MSTADHDSRLLERYRGIRVVVFGAAGFIGRWVARLLSQQGAELTLCVRSPEQSGEIFAAYEVSGKITSLDVTDFESVRQFLSAANPHIVFNLAGYGVDRAETHEETADCINNGLVGELCGTLNDLQVEGWDAQRIVHAGSAQEYGHVAGNLSESSATNPTTLYGRSKLAGTTKLLFFCRAFGLRGLTARIFTAYGPGEHAGRLLPSLLECARSGHPLPLSHGRQKRDFTYVQDIAEGLLRLGLSDAQPGEIVNLATGKLTSVREFAESAAAVLGIPHSHLQFGAVPTRAEEMEHLPVMVDRLHTLTRWIAPVDVHAGISQAWDFLKMLEERTR